ncbi:MAG: hypothetical protein ACRYFX_08150 [Janthinobacterium lividum]
MAKQPSPDPQRMETLYDRAQSDPQFFHDLIWNTEKLLPALDFLTRQEKAALLAMEPEELLQRITSGRSTITGPADALDCGASCTVTCTMSCGATCPGTRLPGRVVEEARYSPEFLATFQQAFNKFQR